MNSLKRYVLEEQKTATDGLSFIERLKKYIDLYDTICLQIEADFAKQRLKEATSNDNN